MLQVTFAPDTPVELRRIAQAWIDEWNFRWLVDGEVRVNMETGGFIDG